MGVPVTATRTANAPKSVVWSVLADYQNIHKYTSQVKTTEQLSEQAAGVGAVRSCALAPLGTTKEEILEWVDDERIVLKLYDTTGIPVKSSRSVFSLREVDADTTEITFDANIEAKGGVMSGFIARRLAKRLPKAAGSLLDDLAAAAEQRIAA